MRKRPILFAGQLLLELESALELLCQANRYVGLNPGIGAQQLSTRITEHIAHSHAHVEDVAAWLVVAKYPHKETRRSVFLFEQNADDQGAEWCCDDGVVTITPLARATLPAAGVPDGWKLVPLEPTIEMIAALGFGGDVELAIGHGSICVELATSYRAALAISPPPPTNDRCLHSCSDDSPRSSK